MPTSSLKLVQETGHRGAHRREGRRPRRRAARHDRAASVTASSVEVDAVIVSVGRRPLSDTLGLDGTGVKVDERGFVAVDEWCRTGEDGV